MATLYDKALRSYLLTKYTPAATTCVKAINNLKENDPQHLNVWTLYLNIATTLTQSGLPTKVLGIPETQNNEQTCRSVWLKLVEQGYKGTVENVDPSLISACLQMTLLLSEPAVGREIAEAWFAALPDKTLDDIATNLSGPMGTSYIEVLDLYIRILTAMKDYDSAREFIEYNTICPDTKKKTLFQTVQDEQDKYLAEKKLKEQKKKEEDAKAKQEAERIELEKKIEMEKKELEQRALEQKKELERQEMLKRESEKAATSLNTTTSRSIEPSSSSPSSSSGNSRNNTTVAPTTTTTTTTTLVKKWVGTLTTKGATSYAAVLVIIFALLSMLRGQRGRLNMALQNGLNKLLQTIKMGTKVTYM